MTNEFKRNKPNRIGPVRVSGRTSPNVERGIEQIKSYSGKRPEVTPDEVNRAHKFSDVDASAVSQHHTLGPKPTQAAAGNHQHYLTSPDGSRWRVKVSDAGALSAEKIV